MRRFNITVNGQNYDVAVEELGASATPVAAPATAPAPAPAPAPAAAPAPAPAPAPVGEGTKVTCPMPGTIVDTKVSVGQAVKTGDVVVVLEAMKMENDIVAPCDGTVTSLVAKKGDTVNSGDVLATIA